MAENMVHGYEQPGWESLDSESTLSSQRSLSSEDAGEIDLVHDNESFIAIGRSVLSGVKQNASENPWDFVPRRLRHAFFDAVKKRKQNLPMFPDPGEEESVILTRKLDNILPDSIPSWSKQLPLGNSNRQNIQHEQLYHNPKPVHPTSNIYTHSMNSSNMENRPPRGTTISRQNIMSVPQYNQHYSVISKLDHISEGNEDEESQFIGVVNNKYLFMHNQMHNGTHNYNNSRAAPSDAGSSVIFEATRDSESEVGSSIFEASSDVGNTIFEANFENTELREEPNNQYPRNTYPVVEQAIVENNEDSDQSSFTYAQIMKQRSETRLQLLSEIRKTNDIIANSGMPDMVKLGQQHLIHLKAELEKLNSTRGEMMDIKGMVQPLMSIPSTSDSSTKSSDVAESNFDTVPLESPSKTLNTNHYISEMVSSNSSSTAGNKEFDAVSQSSNNQKIKSDALSPKSRNSRSKVTSPNRMNGSAKLEERLYSPQPTIQPHNPTRWTRVEAPDNLPGGYRFKAKSGEKNFIATVPPGGVKKGEIFDTPVDNDEESVIIGQWRDGMFSCLTDGVDHPMFLNGLFCPQIALVQVMSRLNLNWTGHPQEGTKKSKAFAFAAVLSIFFIVSNALIFSVPLDFYLVNYILLVIFNTIFFGFFTLLVSRVREQVRLRYSISEDSRCVPGCEDLLMSVMCTMCTITQMGRHSAEYRTYRALCCSENGLPSHVKVPLPASRQATPMSMKYVAMRTP